MPDKVKSVILVSPVVDPSTARGDTNANKIILAKKLRAHKLIKNYVLSRTKLYISKMTDIIDPVLLQQYVTMMNNIDSKVILDSAYALFTEDIRDQIDALNQIEKVLIVNSVDEEKLF